MLTAWKKQEELSFLKDVSSVPLQQAIILAEEIDFTPMRDYALKMLTEIEDQS